MIYNRQETYLQLLPDILSDDALIFVKRMYPINYAHSKLWPFHWTKTTWSFRKMANATSVTLIILWMFLQNIRLCTISSALTKKNKSSYERALKPFFLFYCLSHTLSLSRLIFSLFLSHFAFSGEICNLTSIAFLKSMFLWYMLIDHLLACSICFLKLVSLNHIGLFQFHRWNHYIQSVTPFAKVKYSLNR